jgi:diguanylate cyclase (GGDEF)-like protein/PAS domain S-box-containing protein
MIRNQLNYYIGIALLISVVSIVFYKSLFEDRPLNEALDTIEEINGLQVQLHRDLLRYRSSQIQQYDTLNNTIRELHGHIVRLTANTALSDEIGTSTIRNLERSITHQSLLVEDFKTHHSILQNSLFYIYNLSNYLYSYTPKTQSKQQLRITAELITLLLQYNENPDFSNANKIYPLIDQLNIAPDSDTKSLINHSLMIIERLPEIDGILARFNSLNVENQITNLKDTVAALRKKHSTYANNFNIILFLSSLYIIFYMIYIFIDLQRKKELVSVANEKLNEEVAQRSRTEKALYQLVEIDRVNSNEEDRILHVLDALCKALDMEYAYICKINSSGLSADILGFLDHGIFTSVQTYQLVNTPCEEVIRFGRLVYNSDMSSYFPEMEAPFDSDIQSYIGIALKDQESNINGIIAVASKHPVEDTSLAENILTIATTRASLELAHQIELDNTKRYQQGLKLIDDWIAHLITQGYDRDDFFSNICRAAQEITNAQLAAFPVLSPDRRSYQFLASSGLQAERMSSLSMDIDDGGICAWSMLKNRNVVVNDIKSDERTQKEFAREFYVKSALITPVTLRDEAYGAIAVFRINDEFDETDEQLITQFSQSVQMAIINMQLVSDMRSERERAQVTLHSIADAVITTNTHGEIEYMNHVAESLTAWKLSEARNLSVQTVFRIEDLDTDEPIHDVVNSCLDDGISINKSIMRLISRNGNKNDIESSISPILNTSGEPEGVVIVFHDETQRRQLEKTIKHQAAHDTLTDLLNRDAFNNELTEVVYDVIDSDRQHMLCYLDLERFKLVNDTAGRSAGDQCLIQITSIIESCVRSEDTVARLGGDEFGIILKNCTRQGAIDTCSKIQQQITETPFRWDNCDYNIGVSIGINQIEGNTRDSADALRKADLACYTAKDQGGNNIYIYQEQDSELIRREEETFWASRIRDAIDNDRVKLYAQPIISLKDDKRRREHIEILVRLIDEDGLLIAPGAFIPAAERYNLMHLIDRKVVKETFRFIHKLDNSNLDAGMSYTINLSGNTLGDDQFIDHVSELIKRYHIDTKRICFEITETAAIKNLGQAKSLIKDLKSLGFKFALDDFGSGLSSFHYLKNLSVDFLKIDGSFVADMVNNNIDQAMVAAINEVGHIMGIETIAEYVENEQIMKKLQEIRVDYAQGYGIEQPAPLTEIIRSSEGSPSLKIIKNPSKP